MVPIAPEVLQFLLEAAEENRLAEQQRFIDTHSSAMRPVPASMRAQRPTQYDSPARARMMRDMSRKMAGFPDGEYFPQDQFRLSGAPAGAIQRPMLFAGVNSDTFAAGDTGNMIRIQQKIGSDFFITHFMFRYASTQDQVQVNVIDVEDNRPFMLGDLQLCLVGQVKGANNPLQLPFIPLPGEIRLVTGQSIDVQLIDTTVAINPGDVALLLYGYQKAGNVMVGQR